MSNTRCEAIHWMSPILFVAMLISFMLPILETLIIYLLLLGSTLAHWHYGTIIVSHQIQKSHEKKNLISY